MNIRSMIKHVAAIITAVGMLLASMAGAVTALAEDSKPTTVWTRRRRTRPRRTSV